MFGPTACLERRPKSSWGCHEGQTNVSTSACMHACSHHLRLGSHTSIIGLLAPLAPTAWEVTRAFLGSSLFWHPLNISSGSVPSEKKVHSVRTGSDIAPPPLQTMLSRRRSRGSFRGCEINAHSRFLGRTRMAQHCPRGKGGPCASVAGNLKSAPFFRSGREGVTQSVAAHMQPIFFCQRCRSR